MHNLFEQATIPAKQRVGKIWQQRGTNKTAQAPGHTLATRPATLSQHSWPTLLATLSQHSRNTKGGKEISF